MTASERAAMIEQAANFIHDIAKDEYKHPLYEVETKISKALSVHFEYEGDASEIIERKRPNEIEEAHKYRLSSREPTTYSYANKILNFLKRMFNDYLYSLTYPSEFPTFAAEDGETIRDYLQGKIPEVKDIRVFLEDCVLKSLLADPNGYLVVIPKAPDWATDATQYRKPIPMYVPSESVIFPNSDPEYLVFLSSDKSLVTKYRTGNEKVEEGLIFFLFLPGITLRAVQVGSQSDYDFAIEVWNEYEISNYTTWAGGNMPARKMGGVLNSAKKSVLSQSPQTTFVSHIQSVVPWFNKAIGIDSDISAAFVKDMFPHKYEAVRECHVCSGQDETCQTCEGKGYINGLTPFSTYYVQPKDDGTIPVPAGWIQNPNQGIVELSRNERDYFIEEGFRSINMERLFHMDRSNRAAETVKYDKEGELTFIQQISDNIFELGQFLVDWINLIRYGDALRGQINDNRPVFRKPETFDIATVDDVLEQLQQVKEAPRTFQRGIYLQAVEKIHGKETPDAKREKAYILLDPLFGMTNDDLIEAGQDGDIDPVHGYIHWNIIELVDTLIEEDIDFLDLTISEQREAIYERGKEKRDKLEAEKPDPQPIQIPTPINPNDIDPNNPEPNPVDPTQGNE